MPSSATITAFYNFTANTRARATQVNTNYGVFRGHIIPVNPNTATAIDATYALGSTEYRWTNFYGQQANLEGLTSTTDIKFVPVSTTAGGLDILLGATTISSITPTGFNGATLKPASVPISALASVATLQQQIFTSSTSWTVPTGTTNVLVLGCGGGGGGGAGSTGPVSGGGGGEGAPIGWAYLEVTAGSSITVTIGAGGGSGATGGASAFGSLSFRGGYPGTVGVTAGGSGGGVSVAPATLGHDGLLRVPGQFMSGGRGGTTDFPTNSQSGISSFYASGGSNGVVGYDGIDASYGGGGGGASFGLGANGANGTTANGGTVGASAVANSGGGGGGGSNGHGAMAGGAGGSGGSGKIIVYWGVLT